MPNRSTHDPLGAGAGLVAGVCRVRRRRSRNLYRPVNDSHDALQVVGSTIAGAYGSRLPDIIEPARNPWHRKTAHSASVGTVVASTLRFIDGLEDGLRDTAEAAAVRRRETWRACQSATDILDLIVRLFQAGFYLLAEVLAAFFSGAPAGAIAGYLSHLAADACTARSVPVV